ncbi:2-dehydropantoate 2-reductase [Paucibacter sp. APW11]|uniref:2-dehydropantoate 2-reductase n=1 Tax=Roseateles aquae TaxID=3077235 RepID=A0ABU3P9J1_9BURK|nr:2-dehydropantoate 2-reductase [Paucibacter sp. APW11]MDT8999252.1 2-dehydropantoate 2-reductase [Paucibacter sp. APW11]
MSEAAVAGSAPVLVMGAGAIGCYLGGLLQAAGLAVVFVGRPRVLDALAAHGLNLSDRDGGQRRLRREALRLETSIPAGLQPALTLLCVKSGATAQAAQALQAQLPAGSLVLSMQNGIGNAQRAAAVAPDLRFLAGMVPFNVAELGPGHYHRGTDGDLVAQANAALLPYVEHFGRAGLRLRLVEDMLAVQWGKLLLNLNNPVNALSGLPLREQLLQRGYRRCLAALQDEALALLHQAGIKPAQLTALAPERLPTLLRLPNPLFRLLAARMLKIDAAARSSMADDLALQRVTEIDMLCGEVQRLAQKLGRQAPVNARIQALVQAWPQRPQPYSAEELLRAIG